MRFHGKFFGHIKGDCCTIWNMRIMTEKTIDNLRDRKILIEHMNGKSLKSREHTLEITKIRGASQIVANNSWRFLITWSFLFENIRTQLLHFYCGLVVLTIWVGKYRLGCSQLKACSQIEGGFRKSPGKSTWTFHQQWIFSRQEKRQKTQHANLYFKERADTLEVDSNTEQFSYNHTLKDIS